MSDSDIVNHPKHYTHGGIETIDYMKAKSTHEEFCGHLRLTAIKYLSRAGLKDDTLQDMQKAGWYVNRLIQELQEAQMATRNDVTGDSLISKINTKEYEDNYERIFGKKKTPPVEDGYEQEERLNRISEGYED